VPVVALRLLCGRVWGRFWLRFWAAAPPGRGGTAAHGRPSRVGVPCRRPAGRCGWVAAFGAA